MKLKQTLITISILLGIVCTTTCLLGQTALAATCNGTDTLIIDNCTGSDGIQSILLLAINILSVGVGIVAVGSLVYGAILYGTGGGDVAKTSRAIKLMINVAVGLILYALMYSFLQFLIPGGIFN